MYSGGQDGPAARAKPAPLAEKAQGPWRGGGGADGTDGKRRKEVGLLRKSARLMVQASIQNACDERAPDVLASASSASLCFPAKPTSNMVPRLPAVFCFVPPESWWKAPQHLVGLQQSASQHRAPSQEWFILPQIGINLCIDFRCLFYFTKEETTVFLFQLFLSCWDMLIRRDLCLSCLRLGRPYKAS